MSKHLKILLVSLALVYFPISTATVSAVEITPFTGYRTGGEFENYLTGASIDLRDAENYGVVVDFDIAPGKQIELLYSHQETSARVDPTFIVPSNWNLDVDYYHIGGVSTFQSHRNFRPFVAGGIGATHFAPQRLPSETRFSMSLAGGGKLALNDRIGLRLEARGYWTIFDSYSAIFCGGGGCNVQVQGSSWWQFETNVGLIVNF